MNRYHIALLAVIAAIIALLLLEMPAHAARCRGSNGRYIKCPAPVPAPTPTPTGLAGEQPIADTFDTSLGLEPASGTGALAKTSFDPVGAFRFMCKPGQVARLDPIVFPGQANTGHLHQFWGNTGVTENSTYQSLRTSGASTCDNRSHPDTPVNRTGYWAPAMLTGDGNVVKPDFINTYYKQIPHGSPECQGAPDATHIGWCVDIPNGLRFVFGWNPTTNTGGPTDLNGWDQWMLWFRCWDDLYGTPNAKTGSGNFHSIAEIVAAGCPAGAVLVAEGIIPTCWDGKNLDSPDHRSHIVPADGPYVSTAGSRACPLTHPYPIPAAEFREEFTTDANFAAGKWRLSCDDMTGGKPAGACLHFDYMEAWSPVAKNRWHRNCIDKHLTCASGDLGDGQQMREAGVPTEGWTRHQLVALP